MISNIKHDVGTVELAKKLNEVIRIMNENDTNRIPTFDKNMVRNKLFDLVYLARLEGANDAYGKKDEAKAMYEQRERVMSTLRGMLGVD